MTLFCALNPSLKQLKLIIRQTLPSIHTTLDVETTLCVYWVKAKDNNHPSDKKSNNSSTSVISEKDNIVIFGDSMIKHVNGYDMSKKLKHCKVYIKSFSGSKV